MAVLTATERAHLDEMCPRSKNVGIGTRIGDLEDLGVALLALTGAALVGLADTGGLWTAVNVEAAFAEAAGAGRTIDDTLRSARLASSDSITATSNIRVNRVAVRKTGGTITESDGIATSTVLGVNNRSTLLPTIGVIVGGLAGDVIMSGKATVTAGPQNITMWNRLAAGPEGVVTTWQDNPTMLFTSVLSVAAGDFTVGLLGAGSQIRIFTSVDGDATDTVTLHGRNPAGVHISETLTLLNPSTTFVNSTLTYLELDAVQTNMAMAQNLEIEPIAGGANIITIVAGAAGWYGRVAFNTGSNALGHAVEICAAAACAGIVVLFGTDGAGANQYEAITMNGTSWVRSTKAWNALTHVYQGADNAVTATFSVRVPADSAGMPVGVARANITHDATGIAQVGPDAMRWCELFKLWLTTSAGAAMVGILDAGNLYAALNVEDALQEIAGVGRTDDDTVRSGRLANVDTYTMTGTVRNNRVAARTAGATNIEHDGVATSRVLGVNNTGASIVAAAGDVVVNGKATVTAGPQNITMWDRLAAGPEGVVTTWQNNQAMLFTSVLSAAAGDFTVGLLGAGSTIDVFTTGVGAGGDTGDIVWLYGWSAAGVYQAEALTLVNPSTDHVTSLLTYAGLAAVQTMAQNVETIEIEPTAGGANIISIAPAVAGWYGRIAFNTSSDALGHAVEICAAAAPCAGVVILVGTDGAGAPQYELITMNGTSWVRSTKAWNAVTHVYQGSDNAATATFNMRVPPDSSTMPVGVARANITHDATGSAQVGPDAMRWCELMRAWLATTAGATGVGVLDALGLYANATAEACFAEIAGTGRVVGDTVRTARTGQVTNVVATTAIGNNLIAQRDAAGNYELSDGTGICLGVNNTGAAIDPAGVTAGDLIARGPATITAGEHALTMGMDLAGGSLGKAVPHVPVQVSLASAVLSAAAGDFTIGLLGAGSQIRIFTSLDGDAGDTVRLYGLSAAGVYQTEQLTLANPSTNFVNSVLTYTVLGAVQTEAAMAQTLEVEPIAGGVNIVTIVGGAAAWYGRIVPDDTIQAQGHRVWIVSGEAGTTGVVILVGTNGAGAVIAEAITMLGQTPILSTLAYETVTAVYQGSDDEATATYSIYIAADGFRNYLGQCNAPAGIAQNATGAALIRI